MANTKKADVPGEQPRFDLVKDGARVLWLSKHWEDGTPQVEIGTVIYVQGRLVGLVWLEGYRSRNDDVMMDDLLSVADPNAPMVDFHGFIGRGHILPAGKAWLEKNPKP